MAYKELVRWLLSKWTVKVRKDHRWKQWKMAEALRITDRAYSDLEHGKYCFSAISLLFLMLVMTQEQREEMLKEFEAMVASVEELEAV